MTRLTHHAPTRPGRRRTRGLGSRLAGLLVALVVLAPAARADTAASQSADSAAQVRAELAAALDAADRGRRVPAATRPELSRLARDKERIDRACTSEPGEVRHRVCPVGDTSGIRTVVLWGSSHMNMWISGLVGQARRQGVRLVPLVKFGCTPIDLPEVRNRVVWRECTQNRRWALGRIAAIHPDQVVVSTHRDFPVRLGDGRIVDAGSAPRVFRQATRRTLDLLGPRADAVTVLGGIPYLREDPQVCLPREQRSLRACEGRNGGVTGTVNTAMERAARGAGAGFVHPQGLMCLRGRCPVAAAGGYVYRNHYHVSRTWARHVGSLLFARLQLAG